MAHYGIWTLVGSFLGYYGLLRLGVGAGIMRYVPFYRGTNDESAASQVASTAMAMFLVISSAILLISMLVAEPIARFYEGGPELASLIRILGVAAALECPQRILDACVRAHEHWIVANFVTIVAAIGRALGLVGCVHFGYGVVEMGYVVLVVTILMGFAMAVVFARFCPHIQLRPSMIKLSQGQALLSFGILTAIASLVYAHTLQGHSLIIGKLISLEAVTVYAVPVLLIRNIRHGLLAPARVFWPRFAYLDGKDDSDKVASLFFRGTRLTAIFASGVMLIVFVVGPSFIRLWMPGEDFSAAYPVLLLLAGGYLIEGSQGIMTQLLSGTGHQAAQATFAAIEGAIGVSLSIILTWQLGLTGAALGFVIAIVLMRGIVCPWYVCRLLGTSLLRYYTTELLRPWLILAILTLGMYGLRLPKYVQGWLSWIGFGVALGSLYAFCVYAVALNTGERERILCYIKKLSMPIANLSASDRKKLR